MMVESEALLKSLGDVPDVDEEALGSAGVSPPSAPVSARDAPKDKPMRRRRAGGQRRKRKEPDDSDAPYANPPKRTRHPRGNKVKEQETSTTPTTSRNPAKRRESSTPTGSDAATPDPVAAPTPNDDEDAM
ncbi:hypothetical protein ONZ45_g740 [Pleurotus djamor]|nr:hypothetical protein ONZ45_g740 [Pleurotus djamor]